MAPGGVAGPERISLSAPTRYGRQSLEETLSHRRSVRRYDTRALTWEELGQMMWAAQGTTSEEGFRTAPSAGALYPLERYAVVAGGVYRYDPANHAVIKTADGDRRERLYEAALRQEAVRQAPALFVLAAVYERTAAKYGQRAERYVHLETGHAAQNLLLQADALGLGAVPIGAFHDEQVQSAIGLPTEQQPLYLIPVGALSTD
jgi:SagB-type dehydrogenase family enzyme